MSDNGRDFWDGALSLTPAAQRWHSVGAILLPYEASKCDITLFVYCCNHEATILDTLATVREAMDVVGKSYELVIIDDHSEDRTAELIHGFMAEFPKLPVVLRSNKRRKGLACNYIDAAFIGCGRYYRLVRGDNSEPVETVVDVLKAIGDADVVVPYYVFSHHGASDRQHLRSGYTRLINAFSGNHINHYEAAHLHLRYNVMRWHPVTEGVAFQADLLCRLLDEGFTMKQVPCRAMPHMSGPRDSGWRRFCSTLHMLLDLMFRRLR